MWMRIWATLALFFQSALALSGTTYVTPDSEMGKMMSQLDAAGRFHQNTKLINASISKFDKDCGHVEATGLIEPGERLSAKKYRYIVSSRTEKCGDQLYRSTIVFKDTPRTLIKSISVEGQESFSDYESFLAEFIDVTKAKDVGKMVSMTSDVTIQMSGHDKLKSHFLADIVPAIGNCTSIAPDGGVFYVSKAETGTGSGFGFINTCHFGEGKKLLIQFIVLREKGRLVLASLGPAQ